MKLRQDELLTRMQQAPTEAALFDMLKIEAQQLGFEHCAYGLRLPLNLSQPRFVLFNTYPATWQQRYLEQNYIATDPTIRHAQQSLAPLVWNNEVFSETPQLWADARAHGLRYGWVQPSIGERGIRGMLTLSRRTTPLSRGELKAHAQQMTWLTHITHHCMSSLVSAHMIPEVTVHLSPREKDVLRWTAEGKTSREISDIVVITERTVNFHIANAIRKLNCVNKTAATVRAALIGLI